jgi:hypothetical protein
MAVGSGQQLCDLLRHDMWSKQHSNDVLRSPPADSDPQTSIEQFLRTNCI